MRLALLFAAVVAVAACDAYPDGPIVAGTYRSVGVADGTSGAEATIDVQIPLPRSGAFRLGSQSVYRADLGASSQTLALTGAGSVDGSAVSVTFDAFPAVVLSGGEIRLEASGPVVYHGSVSTDGGRLVLRDGPSRLTFERVAPFHIDISRAGGARRRDG